jgi:hypothetical protein
MSADALVMRWYRLPWSRWSVAMSMGRNVQVWLFRAAASVGWLLPVFSRGRSSCPVGVSTWYW